jgi:hypothetical protein
MREYLPDLVCLLVWLMAASGTCMAAGLMVDVGNPWSEEFAYAGNTNIPVIPWVSVHNLDGLPMHDLKANDFRITRLVAPKDIYRSNFTVRNADEVHAGVYAIDIIREDSENWSPGHYLLQIEVVTGNDTGQAMLPLTMLEQHPLNESNDSGPSESVCCSPPPIYPSSALH